MGERFPPPSHPPISPAQCSTCQPFAVSFLQSGMLHKTQTNTNRVSKSLLFYDKIDEIYIDGKGGVQIIKMEIFNGICH